MEIEVSLSDIDSEITDRVDGTWMQGLDFSLLMRTGPLLDSGPFRQLFKSRPKTPPGLATSSHSGFNLGCQGRSASGGAAKGRLQPPLCIWLAESFFASDSSTIHSFNIQGPAVNRLGQPPLNC